MSNRLKRAFASLMIACIFTAFLPMFQMTAYAATGKITFSDPTVTVGQNVTVSMKVSTTDGSALGGANIMVAYDPNMLEFVSGGDNANGGAGAIKVLGVMGGSDTSAFSYQFTFKTLQAGTTSLSISSQEVYDKDLGVVTIDHVGSSTVTVQAPETYSSDANLASLTISPGTLNPAFSAGVTSYTATVGSGVDKLAVSAVTSHSGAKTRSTGFNDLKTGENKVTVRVTAEDGKTVKDYVIMVTKEEGSAGTETSPSETAETSPAEIGELKATIGEKEFSVANSFDETGLPEGFEATTYSYKGNEVMAGKGLAKDLLLLYLVDAEGNGAFYIYNETQDSFYLMTDINASSKTVTMLPLEDGVVAPDGYTLTTVNVEGTDIEAWIANSDIERQSCIFYGMNWDGAKNWYRYDLVEKTLQRYFGGGEVDESKYKPMEEFVDVATRLNNMIDTYQSDMLVRLIIIIVLAVLCLALFIAVVLLWMKRKDRTEPENFDDPAADEADENLKEVEMALAQTVASLANGGQQADKSLEKPKKEAKVSPKEADDDDFEFMDIDE